MYSFLMYRICCNITVQVFSEKCFFLLTLHIWYKYEARKEQATKQTDFSFYQKNCSCENLRTLQGKGCTDTICHFGQFIWQWLLLPILHHGLIPLWHVSSISDLSYSKSKGQLLGSCKGSWFEWTTNLNSYLFWFKTI